MQALCGASGPVAESSLVQARLYPLTVRLFPLLNSAGTVPGPPNAREFRHKAKPPNLRFEERRLPLGSWVQFISLEYSSRQIYPLFSRTSSCLGRVSGARWMSSITLPLAQGGELSYHNTPARMTEVRMRMMMI